MFYFNRFVVVMGGSACMFLIMDYPTTYKQSLVEEALCFGWIDSLVHRLDEERYMQKFTPRKMKSTWSKHNGRYA